MWANEQTAHLKRLSKAQVVLYPLFTALREAKYIRFIKTIIFLSVE